MTAQDISTATEGSGFKAHCCRQSLGLQSKTSTPQHPPARKTKPRHSGTDLHKALFLRLHLLRAKWKRNGAEMLWMEGKCERQNKESYRFSADYRENLPVNIKYSARIQRRHQLSRYVYTTEEDQCDLLLSFPVGGSCGSCRPLRPDMGVLVGLVCTDPLRGCALHDREKWQTEW